MYPTVLGSFFEIFLERTALFSCPNCELSVNIQKNFLLLCSVANIANNSQFYTLLSVFLRMHSKKCSFAAFRYVLVIGISLPSYRTKLSVFMDLMFRKLTQ